MQTNRRTGVWSNVFYGIVGSILGYWLFVDVLRLGVMDTSTNYFSGLALIWEIVGAIVFLVIVNMISYGQIETIEEKRGYGPSTAKEYREKHDKEDRWK